MGKFSVMDYMNGESMKMAQEELSKPGELTKVSVFDIEPNENNFYGIRGIKMLKESILMLGGVQENLSLVKNPSGSRYRYKALAGHRRRIACMELVQRAVKGKHKVLLFSQFTSMLDLIRERLAEQNTKYYCLTGNTDKQERQRLVDEFQNDDTPVFLISLKAGGTGLNLTAADIVIHYDPWWNVAAQNQATDRAHRIGQKNTVTVYRFDRKGLS